MKIIHQVQVEDGDTLASIAAGVSKYTGVQHTTANIWDFNRQSMPSPGSMPPVGTVLRFPHDPHGGNVEGSGGPTLNELKGQHVSEADLAKSSTTLGGDSPKSTPANPEGSTNGEPAGGDKPSDGQEEGADAASKAAGGTVVGEGTTAGAGAPGAAPGAEDGFEV